MAARVGPPTNDQLCVRHGRTFSEYGLRNNVYVVPIDRREQKRQADLDDLVRDVIGESCIVPMPSPVRGSQGEFEALPTVLDCGSGSGIWIERLLEERQGSIELAKATAVDICLNQRISENDEDEEGEDDGDDQGIQEWHKKRWNLNTPFSSDQRRHGLRREQFDVVHSRFLADGIDRTRWQSYVGELRQLLKKGGWVQMVELIPFIQSENGRLSDDSFLTTWWTSYSTMVNHMGKNVRVGRELKRMLEDEGFSPVRDNVYSVPIGTWGRNQDLGRANRAMVQEMLISLSLRPLLHYGSMPVDRYQSLIAGAVRELHDDSLKLYYRLYVVCGRRPTSRRR